MEFLGIGPSELVFIVIIALIVLGPKDMQKAGRSLGKWLRRLVTSDGWKLFQQTSREIQTLPNRLMREAALDELKVVQKELKQPLGASPQFAELDSSGSPKPTESGLNGMQSNTISENNILPTPPIAKKPDGEDFKNA